MRIGVAAFPEGHVDAVDLQQDAQVLRQKHDAGAEFAVTDMVLRASDYVGLVERAEAAGADLPIIPGIMPILNLRSMERMVEFSGRQLPDEVVARLVPLSDDPAALRAEGVAIATELCEALLDAGAPGLHFYTLTGRGRRARSSRTCASRSDRRPPGSGRVGSMRTVTVTGTGTSRIAPDTARRPPRRGRPRRRRLRGLRRDGGRCGDGRRGGRSAHRGPAGRVDRHHGVALARPTRAGARATRRATATPSPAPTSPRRAPCSPSWPARSATGWPSTGVALEVTDDAVAAGKAREAAFHDARERAAALARMSGPGSEPCSRSSRATRAAARSPSRRSRSPRPAASSRGSRR